MADYLALRQQFPNVQFEEITDRMLQQPEFANIPAPGFDRALVFVGGTGFQPGRVYRIAQGIGQDGGKVEKPRDGMQGNGWYLDVLTHSRGIAGRWLKARADAFEAPARAHLLAAADHYGKLADACMEGLGCPWDLALPPDKVGEWTPEMRADQVGRLEAAREHDRAAIAEIEAALAAANE